VTARSGDIYALVTDGFTEVFDANDSELGLDPLKETIRVHASRQLSDIVGRIVDVSRGYGLQRDDQTVLLIRMA
jgi:serine phosphatase RsbU (regulator of sigma subunit)